MVDNIELVEPIGVKDFSDWDTVFEYLATNYDEYDRVNPAFIIPSENLTDPGNLTKFTSAELRSFNIGASRVYRDKNDQCSIQVRVYESGEPIPHAPEPTYDHGMYHIQLNWHNPNDVYGALKHLFVDVLKIDLPGIEKKCK